MSAVGHAHDEAQGERAGDLGCQGRVAAHEHEPQQVVLDEVARVGHRGGGRRCRAGVDDEHRHLARRHRLGAQPVEHPTPGRGHQPRGGPVRDAVARPGARRGLDGVGERVLDEVEPAELREEEGDQAPPLLAHRPGEDLVGRHCGSYPSILITGRISTV